MNQEIERKFLVRGDGWRPGAHGVLCRQGYLSSAIGCTVRVRLMGDAALLTIKGATKGITKLEYEYPIPTADAQALLDRLCVKPLIEKRRFTVPFAGMTWEIDEFLGENQGLLVAEVELEAEDQPVELPAWAGAEVSGDPRYFNVNLVRHPYAHWGTNQAPHPT